jgi:DNA-binding MarR family transcriptional regulator
MSPLDVQDSVVKNYFVQNDWGTRLRSERDTCPLGKPPRPEFENVDPLTARVFHAFGRALHLNRLAVGRMSQQLGVQHGEAFALPLLCRNEGVSQRELAGILHLSPPRVSMLLRSLEGSGAIVRRADETDRRLTRVYVTEEGRVREKQQRAILEDYVNQTIGALSEADRLELERILGMLADYTQAVLREGSQGKEQVEESTT